MRLHVRSRGLALVLAVVLAAALCLEQLARELTAKPVRFLDVAIVEVVAGLAFAAAVLAPSSRLIK